MKKLIFLAEFSASRIMVFFNLNLTNSQGYNSFLNQSQFLYRLIKNSFLKKIHKSKKKMSITMGKRTFNNAVSEMSHERLLHHQADFRRIKGNFNSNDSTFDLLHTNKQKNIVKLEQLFPNKTKNVLNFCKVISLFLIKTKGIDSAYGGFR